VKGPAVWRVVTRRIPSPLPADAITPVAIATLTRLIGRRPHDLNHPCACTTSVPPSSTDHHHDRTYRPDSINQATRTGRLHAPSPNRTSGAKRRSRIAFLASRSRKPAPP
jgi:hypothetical protein